MRLMIMLLVSLVGLSAGAQELCYINQTGQAIPTQRLRGLASHIAHSHHRCVDAADFVTKQSFEFDQDGNQLDEYSESLAGCIIFYCYTNP